MREHSALFVTCIALACTDEPTARLVSRGGMSQKIERMEQRKSNRECRAFSSHFVMCKSTVGMDTYVATIKNKIKPSVLAEGLGLLKRFAENTY
jgi:hypothetical protein